MGMNRCLCLPFPPPYRLFFMDNRKEDQAAGRTSNRGWMVHWELLLRDTNTHQSGSFLKNCWDIVLLSYRLLGRLRLHEKVRGRRRGRKSPVLIFDMCLPLHAKEYEIAVVPLIFILGTSTAPLLTKAKLCDFPIVGQCTVDTIWPFSGRGELA